MDTGLFMGLSGVIISIFLYLLADRKTIGAKREKIDSNYDEIVKTIFRSVIHEEYIPSLEEIDRMISTICVENRLKSNHFPIPLEFINAVYTRIMQDDVLEGSKKKVLIEKINNYIETNSKKVSDEIEDEEGEINLDDRLRLSLMMISSVMAVMITYLTIDRTALYSREQIPLLLGTFIVALASIMTVTFIKRFKEEDTISKQMQDRFKEYRELESRIAGLLKSQKYSFEPKITTTKGIVRPDFQLKVRDTTYYIEIKSFTSLAPRSSIYQLRELGKQLKSQDRKSVTILLTNNKRAIAPYYEELSSIWDYIFDEKEFKIFRNKLVHES